MKNVLRRLFCKGCQQFLFTIFFLPNHHISYDTSCFSLGIAVFSKEIEDNVYLFFWGGGERRGQIRCIMGSVQMVNYSLGKRYIYHLESTIWIKDSISRSHSLTRVKNWTLSGLLHKDKVSKETTRNFAFCACPNFASSYFASGSEGRKVYDL